MPLRIEIPPGTGTNPFNFSRDDILSPFVELLPLPAEQFPRVVELKKKDRGYYVALGLVMLLWGVTPGSAIYILWYLLSGRHKAGVKSFPLAALATWATVEVLFAVYHWYLVHYIQSPSPPASLPVEIRHSLFHKVLHDGLSFVQPEQPSLFPLQSSSRATISGGSARPRSHSYVQSSPVTRIQPSMPDPDPTRKDRVIISTKEPKPELQPQDHPDLLLPSTPLERAGFQSDELWLRDWSSPRRKSSVVEFAEVDTPISTLSEVEPMENMDGNPVVLHAHDQRAVEFRERMRTWFNHAPWSSLRRQNVAMWLSWSCFGLPLEDVSMDPENVTYLNKSIRFIEARTGMPIPEGYDPKVEVLRLTLDPVIARGRPFILYVGTTLINNWLLRVQYPSEGISFHKEGDIEYLLRIPAGWTPEMGRTVHNAIPVVYLDGLGFGLIQNHLLIKHLIRSLPSHPLLIPLAPHTSQAIFHHRHLKPWTRPEFINAMKKICTKWCFWDAGDGGKEDMGGVSMMSHSNGSVAHGWILKECPGMTRRNTFVDPVVFCLWEGDVCHSFCYRKPSTALELLLYYFIATETGIANYIQRHFDWAENTLFFDEIPNALDPRRTAVFLGGEDIIIDAARTRKYLEGHGMTRGLHWDANHGHGDGLKGPARNRIVMYTGTGSTRGWQGWLETGRHVHSAVPNDGAIEDQDIAEDDEVDVHLDGEDDQWRRQSLNEGKKER